VTLLIVATLAGIFSGLYFRFLILVPATLALAIASVSAALLEGVGFGSALLSTILPAVALQGGYMIGLTARDHLANLLVRANRVQSKRV
jgi:hypothetical protein